MKVNIINKIPNKIKNKILNTIKCILKNKKNKTINIKITTAINIKILNKKYRGKNKETDVLTFKNENIKLHNDIGTIILCPKIMKKTKKNYWETTLIHSILHMLNYDHLKNKDFVIMSKLEKKLGMSGIEPPTITTSK